mmetsp:Transcript_4296/g.10553  ORF Transcript_4296/g.10553 Transcript_4296/m.10553 type:complete len:294 (-) Transcript_4296:55-936(-)
MKSNIVLFGLLNNVMHDLGSTFIEERVADFDVVHSFLEGVRHTTTNDHHVYLVQEVHNQLDLIRNLGTTKNGKERTHRFVECLGKVGELLVHEQTSSTLRKIHTNHRTVSTVSSTKGIVHIDVRQLGERSSEGNHLGRSSILALLGGMEAQVLQQHHLTRLESSTGGLHLRTDAVVQEAHILAFQKFTETVSYWLEGEFLRALAIGTTEMGGQHHTATTIQDGFNRRESSHNTLITGNLSVLHRNIKVHTNENALSSNAEVIDREFVQRRILRSHVFEARPGENVCRCHVRCG